MITKTIASVLLKALWNTNDLDWITKRLAGMSDDKTNDIDNNKLALIVLSIQRMANTLQNASNTLSSIDNSLSNINDKLHDLNCLHDKTINVLKDMCLEVSVK